MIAVDANGADGGPGVVAKGARLSGVETLVFDGPEKIASGPDPVRAVRENPNASVVLAAKSVGEGRADALVTAGSTGPTLAAATLYIKRIKGIHRPALAVLLPVPDGPVLLLDCGASVEARPEHLVQFAHMGSAFMAAVQGVPHPRVGLLSVGEEQGKGTGAVLEAAERLGDAVNIEGFDIPRGTVDVVVTDGFTGNVALKVLEAASKTVTGAIREAVRRDPISTLGGLLIKRNVEKLRAELDPERVGGAVLLGLRKPVVVAHGSFGPEGIANAIRLARRAVDERMVERTHSALEAAGALRSASAASVAGR